ncbi:MAG: hypothetical protein WBV78_17660 [Roseobacter sp.]
MNARPDRYATVMSPELQAQISRLVATIPRPRYSDTVQQMLIRHGLILEDEVAEMRKVSVATLQAQRSRGQMPPQ